MLFDIKLFLFACNGLTVCVQTFSTSLRHGLLSIIRSKQKSRTLLIGCNQVCYSVTSWIPSREKCPGETVFKMQKPFIESGKNWHETILKVDWVHSECIFCLYFWFYASGYSISEWRNPEHLGPMNGWHTHAIFCILIYIGRLHE